jgi:hypothetical protein
LLGPDVVLLDEDDDDDDDDDEEEEEDFESLEVEAGGLVSFLAACLYSLLR